MDHEGTFQNEFDEAEDFSSLQDGLTQDELDGVDSPALRVRLLTLHQKRQVSQRLEQLEENDRNSGKALFGEHHEMFEAISLEQLMEMEELPVSELAFYESSIYLEDLYSYKKLKSKWS